MTKIIRADEIFNTKPDEDKVIAFNNQLNNHLKNYPYERSMNLYFDRWGYHWEDIKFIEEAGYMVYRNSACLWWEISW